MLNVASGEAYQEQLTLFDVVEEEIPVRGNVLYARFVNGDIALYYDKDGKDLFRLCENTTLMERVLRQQSVFFSFNDGTAATYKIVWEK